MPASIFKRSMRIILFILVWFAITCFAIFISCSSPNTDKKKIIKTNATSIDFKKYKNKKIEKMEYCKGCGGSGDLLIVTFTDSTVLKLYSYKYNMQVYED